MPLSFSRDASCVAEPILADPAPRRVAALQGLYLVELLEKPSSADPTTGGA